MHIVIVLQEQTKTRTGWLVGHSNSWAIVMNKCWDMRSSVLDVERCYRKVFMRVGNVSRSRRMNIPEYVFAQNGRIIRAPNPKPDTQTPSTIRITAHSWTRNENNRVRFVHVLKHEIGLVFAPNVTM